MPIYVFECECGNQFDEVCKMGVQKVQCPECGKEAKKSIDSYLSYANGLPNGFAATNSR